MISPNNRMIPPHIMNIVQQNMNIIHQPPQPMVNIPFPILMPMQPPTNLQFPAMQYQSMYAQPHLHRSQLPPQMQPVMPNHTVPIRRDPRLANRDIRREQSSPVNTNPNLNRNLSPVSRPNFMKKRETSAESMAKRRPITLNDYKAKSLKKCDENDLNQSSSMQQQHADYQNGFNEQSKSHEQPAIDRDEDYSNEPVFSPTVSDETACSSAVPSPTGSLTNAHSPSALSPVENSEPHQSQDQNESETIDNVTTDEISINGPQQSLVNGYESDASSFDSDATEDFEYDRFLEQHHKILQKEREKAIETALGTENALFPSYFMYNNNNNCLVHFLLNRCSRSKI